MNRQLVDYLKTRRTIPSLQLSEPGPGESTLREMLSIAARVPDHGKLAPWRFIMLPRTSREDVVKGLVRIAAHAVNEKEQRIRAEKARAFAEAPLVVAVVSAPIVDHPKIPLWEQQLSAAAVCLNLLHAAYAYGFAAQWLTGWFAYDDEAMRWFGLRPGERIAGFLHIGTATAPPAERDRPDLDRIVTEWSAPNGE
jgi:nitroreductase